MKLLYGLHTACLSKAELRRIDGFYTRCLRRVLRIPPAYVSRVSNEVVLQRGRRRKLSARLLEQQLFLLGNLAARDSGDPVRDSIFQPGSLVQRDLGRLKRGRPRRTWAEVVCKAALEVAGTSEQLSSLLAPTSSAQRAWRSAVKRYTHNL